MRHPDLRPRSVPGFRARLSAGLMLAGLTFAAVTAVPLVAVAQDYVPRNRSGGEGIEGPAVVELDDAPDFAPRDGADPYVLSFVGGDYAPPAGIDPAMRRAATRVMRDPESPQETFGYIMVRGRLNDPRKMDVLRRLGIEILDPHTWQSVGARIPFHALDALATLPFVRWVGYARPAQKVGPRLQSALDAGSPDARHEIHVSTFVSDLNASSRVQAQPAERTVDPRAVVMPLHAMIPNGRFQRALETAGFTFRYYNDVENVHVFSGTATADAIRRIASFDFVSYVEADVPVEAHHDQSMAMVGLDRTRSSQDGDAVPCGVIDTGIDASPWHDDFAGKSMFGFATLGAGSAFNDDHGHGTHVAGTVFGEGVADPRFRGGCPKMGNLGNGYRVFIGRYLDQSGRGQGNVGDLYSRFASDIVSGGRTNKRPRVINNSWGSKASQDKWVGTEFGSRLVDPYVYNQQLYVFSSGNDGLGVGSPGVAKNVLTVGSVLDTGTRAGGLGTSMFGTKDFRTKPEVTAPGEYVTSCEYDTTNDYSTKRGTSMAAPHVTAACSGLAERYSFLDYNPWCIQALAIGTAQYRGQTLGAPNTAQGYGMINAYRMQRASSRSDWWTGWSTTKITASGKWAYWDVAVPSNVVGLAATLVWIEPASSSGATKALRSRLQLTLDPSRSSNPTGGVYTTGALTQNKVRRVMSSSVVSQLKGRTVRVKVYGNSVSGTCKVGVALVYYFVDSRTPTPQFTVTTRSRYVKPGASVSITGTWQNASGGDEFANAYITPAAGFGFVATGTSRVLADNVLASYTDASHRSYPYPLVGGTIVVGQGISRSAVFSFRAPSSTSTIATLGLSARADYSTGVITRNLTYYVDGLRPTTPSNLGSTTHTKNVWSNARNFTGTWAASTDPGPSGLQGYGVIVSTTPNHSVLVNTSASTTSTMVTLPSTAGSRYYLNVRALDRSGNVSSTAYEGPFLIDTVAPTAPTVVIDGGNARTNGYDVTLALGASESSSGSGIQAMQFSGDGQQWSPWETFAATRANWDLSRYGGGTNAGTKTVYVRFRDGARNVSPIATDTIEIPVGAWETISPARGPEIGGDTVTIDGAGFVNGSTSVLFGGVAATNVTVVSASRLTCVTPKRLAGGSVSVLVRVGSTGVSRANAYEYVGGRITSSGRPRIGRPFPITFDAPVDGGRPYDASAAFNLGTIPLPGHKAIPLAPDPLFFLTAQNKIPSIYANFKGTLDANGRAVGIITQPNNAALVGYSFHVAFLTLDPAKPLGVRTVSAPASFVIDP